MVGEKDFIATEALYLNKDGKVVKHNDPSKIEKLADVGHRIPYERAKELGLVDDNPDSAKTAEGDGAEKTTDDMSWTADPDLKVTEIAHNLNDGEETDDEAEETADDSEAAPVKTKKAPAKGKK